MSKIKSVQAVPKEVETATRCDWCGKTAASDDYNDPAGWFQFDSHHTDWGNDSVDSYAYHDAYSFDCLLRIANKQTGQLADYPSAVIADLPLAFWDQLHVKIETLKPQDGRRE